MQQVCSGLLQDASDVLRLAPAKTSVSGARDQFAPCAGFELALQARIAPDTMHSTPYGPHLRVLHLSEAQTLVMSPLRTTGWRHSAVAMRA